MHIAKFSDRKKNDFTRDSLSQVLMFNDFPQELVQGINNGTACQGSGYVFQLCILWFPLTNDLNLNWCFQVHLSVRREEKSFDGTQSQV